ncbi:MAG TPA: thymidine phosphorylase [Polyangiaceae bacterium]|nr:thymidine phosphorylase [Polyangiaceae bacterium]
MPALNPVELIVHKRDGGELSAAQIRALISAFLAGEVADYQMSAWLMACFFRGLSDAETEALTLAMLHSGRVLRLPSVRAPKVDKHSTGGVGDKISICLAPLVAACGVAVPMISGRGLGHTGGTLDKLEAIPGYRVALDAKAFERVVRSVGCSLVGQSAELAPADRRIYALRDVTGTVECIPLIVASILSKKLAAGLDALVLDVKVGRGAFMKDRASARKLARALVRVGKRSGKHLVALLTDMNAPIGAAIGNALETKEAIEVLHGKGPPDTRELTLALGAEMLVLGGRAKTSKLARADLEQALASGRALERFRRMVEAHGGDPRVTDDPSRLPSARAVVTVRARQAGFVTNIDALELGLCAVSLGAGRTRADQKVDPGAGIVLGVRIGDRVERGQPLSMLHARSQSMAEAVSDRARAAFEFGPRAAKRRPLVLERIEG